MAEILKKLAHLTLFGTLLVSLGQAPAAFAQDLDPHEMARVLEALPVPSQGSGEPVRFAGWLQPWTVGLIFGLPAVWALVERRGDIVRGLRRRAWRQGDRPES